MIVFVIVWFGYFGPMFEAQDQRAKEAAAAYMACFNGDEMYCKEGETPGTWGRTPIAPSKTCIDLGCEITRRP